MKSSFQKFYARFRRNRQKRVFDFRDDIARIASYDGFFKSSCTLGANDNKICLLLAAKVRNRIYMQQINGALGLFEKF